MKTVEVSAPDARWNRPETAHPSGEKGSRFRTAGKAAGSPLTLFERAGEAMRSRPDRSQHHPLFDRPSSEQ
jgi:hypothetical protein